MATTTQIPNLQINVLTKAQYDAATKDENQIYLITDNNTANYLPINGGTLTGTLILSGDPTTALGAATKQYVDNATANAGTITEIQANGTSIATSGTANIPAASTSVYGVTQLSSSTSSTSTSLAATASAVRSAYNRSATLLNRSTAVNAADTNYTILMARGSSLNSTETTPGVNGAIAWTYE